MSTSNLLDFFHILTRSMIKSVFLSRDEEVYYETYYSS